MKTTRSESARQRLVETASRLFYENGIAATGIDRVLAESGVAKMTLYNTFGSKEALVLEYLRVRYGGFVPALRATIDARTADPTGRILAVFDVLAEWFRSEGFRGCPLLNAAIEFSDPSHPARKLAAELVTAFREYLVELSAAAGVRDPKAMSESLFLLAYGAIAAAQLSGDPASAAQARLVADSHLRAELG